MSLTQHKESIVETYQAMTFPPRVLVASITTVADMEVQKALRKLPITVIAVDEAHVCDPDMDLGWGGFLPYK